MTSYLDSSVLVAALVEDEPAHEACLALLRGKNSASWTHALAETYATLTGGRLGVRMAPSNAALLIENSLVPRLRLIELGGGDLLKAINGCDAAGVRGGAIYDLLHLSAARKSASKTLFTLNTRHFEAIARNGDPSIESPR